MRKFVFVLFLLSFISLPQESPVYFSVQTHFGQIYRPDIDSASILTMLDLIQSAGIKCIRDECYWSLIETSRGIYNFPPLFDFYINSAKQRGIDVMLILNYNNPIYAPHAGSAVTTDSNRLAFAEYCKRVVQRYSPLGIKRYEIWNEPNILMFWDPAPNAQQYKLLLQTVYPVIKSVDTNITVIGCATSPAEGNPSPYISWLSYITQVFNAGGGSFMDAVSFHLYRVDKAPETYLYNDINNLKAIIGGKPIYLTEIGYPTSTVWPNVSQQKQAEYLARVYLLGSKIPELKMISWYDFKNDGEDPANNEHNFGIYNYNYTPKPAYNYYKIMREKIGDKRYASSTSSGGVNSFVYGTENARTWAFWHEAGEVSNIYNFGTARIFEVSRSTGEEYFIHDRDGILTVKYATSPVYYSGVSFLPANTYFGITPRPATVIVNQKINFGLRGLTPQGKTVFVDSALVEWSVPTGNGVIDSLGRFRALSPGQCEVRGIYNSNTYSAAFMIEQGYNFLEIEPFNSANPFSLSFFNMLDTTDVLFITDTAFTTAPSSMGIKYRFRYQGIDKHRVYLDCDYNLLGEPDSIMLDVYGNGNGHVFNFRLEDADGQVFSVNTPASALTNHYGWKTVKAAINKFGTSFDYPAKLTRITFFAVKSGGITDSVYSGKILLDNLRIHNGIIADAKVEGKSFDEKGIIILPPYPNPFSSSISVRFILLKEEQVSFEVYSSLGEKIREVKNQAYGRGEQEWEFRPGNLGSGMYIIRITAGEKSGSAKVLFIR